MPDQKEVIAQIDRALKLYQDHRSKARFNDLSDLGSDVHVEVETIVSATIDRLAPAGSTYRRTLNVTLIGQIGSLKALRRDYEDGYMSTIQALVRSDVFADFLDMAEHLVEQGYKDPGAVLVGGVLEEHLRALCSVRSIDLVVSSRPKKADSMNGDLAKAGAYNKLDQKNVTAWLDLRNSAAHGKYDDYSREQVAAMLAGVREFVARIPAV
ncbi:MAG: hypothetical protein Q8T13_21405 [Acidobacteriota bacterium]|nr:hypothetical protein [Acidobacteriota bacterium]